MDDIGVDAVVDYACYVLGGVRDGIRLQSSILVAEDLARQCESGSGSSGITYTYLSCNNLT